MSMRELRACVNPAHAYKGGVTQLRRIQRDKHSVRVLARRT